MNRREISRLAQGDKNDERARLSSAQLADANRDYCYRDDVARQPEGHIVSITLDEPYRIVKLQKAAPCLKTLLETATTKMDAPTSRYSPLKEQL